MTTHPLLEHVSRARLAEDLWRLVSVPSPTGDERDAALAFADMLARAGADVRLDDRIPASPNVIGRLRGSRPGRTLQLAGHVDHIDVPHPPPRRDDNVISGRGSADMKNGLAGILEVVRLLQEAGCDFAGEVLVTVYGLHEAPVGDSRGLLDLIADGVVGDAAVVFESAAAAEGKAVVAGKGQSVWNLTLRRPGETCHELHRPARADDLLAACLKVAESLQQEARRLRSESQDHPLLGPESLFLGQLHYGDFYNRAADHATLQGTWRWNPGRTFDDVREAFDRLLDAIDLPGGIAVRAGWTFVGESYTVQPDEPIVGALRRAGRAVLGADAEPAGVLAVTDANRLVPVAGVPAVLCGFDCRGAHADHEFVRLDEVERACRLALQTVLNYLETVKESDDA